MQCGSASPAGILRNQYFYRGDSAVMVRSSTINQRLKSKYHGELVLLLDYIIKVLAMEGRVVGLYWLSYKYDRDEREHYKD